MFEDFLNFLQLQPVGFMPKRADYLIDVEHGCLLLKFKPSAQVNMSPGDGRGALEPLGFFALSCFLCCCVERRKNGRVTINDAVGNEARAFTPDLLFKFRPDPELALIVMEDRTLQPVIGLTAVERLLHPLAHAQIIDVGEEIEGFDDVIECP